DVWPERNPSCGGCLHYSPARPPYPIALDGGSNLPRHGEADADRTAVVSLARLQHESGGRHLGCGRGGQEVGALPEPLHGDDAGRAAADVEALSRLRPRARRAATTLRPPLVAMRARKP